jgi:TPR repeat protein
VNGLLDDNELFAREPDLNRLGAARELVSTKFPQGIAELEALAREDSVISMLYLAQAYQREEGSDSTKAEMWYRSAYEKNSSTAFFGLGGIYYRRGDIDESEKIFMAGSSRNDVVSMYWLAVIYLSRGGDNKKLHEHAFPWKDLSPEDTS